LHLELQNGSTLAAVPPRRASAPSDQPAADEAKDEAPLPEHGVCPIAPYTPDLPGLVTDLHLPGTEPQHASLSRVRANIRHSPGHPVDVFRMGPPAFAPRPHSEAVGALLLLLPAGTGGRPAGSGLGQIWARGTPVERGSDDRPRPVLQGPGAARAARGPAGELRHHAVPRARHQAGLLGGRLWREVLTYLVGDQGSVQLLEAADAPVLQPVLGGDAEPGSRLTVSSEGDEPTPVPRRDLPLEQLQVPVADFKAPPLAVGSVLLVAAGVGRRPALCVGAPDGPAPNAPQAAVAHTPAPVTCKRRGVEKQNHRITEW